MQWMLQLALTLNTANAVVDVAQVAAAHAGPSPVLIKWLRLQLDGVNGAVVAVTGSADIANVDVTETADVTASRRSC